MYCICMFLANISSFLGFPQTQTLPICGISIPLGSCKSSCSHRHAITTQSVFFQPDQVVISCLCEQPDSCQFTDLWGNIIPQVQEPVQVRIFLPPFISDVSSLSFPQTFTRMLTKLSTCVYVHATWAMPTPECLFEPLKDIKELYIGFMCLEQTASYSETLHTEPVSTQTGDTLGFICFRQIDGLLRK